MELWQWTEAEGATMIADLNEGSSGSEPHAFIDINDEWTYFSARTEQHGVELWLTNGTTSELLMDIWKGTVGSNPNDFAVLDNRVCFSAQDGVHGR